MLGVIKKRGAALSARRCAWLWFAAWRLSLVVTLWRYPRWALLTGLQLLINAL
jgi:hypothetical protein